MPGLSVKEKEERQTGWPRVAVGFENKVRWVALRSNKT